MNTQLNVKTVLFQTIQFRMSTKLNGFKYYYVSLTIHRTMLYELLICGEQYSKICSCVTNNTMNIVTL